MATFATRNRSRAESTRRATSRRGAFIGERFERVEPREDPSRKPSPQQFGGRKAQGSESRLTDFGAEDVL
jgi:hypothetical protein